MSNNDKVHNSFIKRKHLRVFYIPVAGKVFISSASIETHGSESLSATSSIVSS